MMMIDINHRKIKRSFINFRKHILRDFTNINKNKNKDVNKDVKMPLDFIPSNKFKDDVLKMDSIYLKALYDAINKLRYKEQIKNHTLKRSVKSKQVKELHLGFDILFTYRIDKNAIIGIRVDNHREALKHRFIVI